MHSTKRHKAPRKLQIFQKQIQTVVVKCQRVVSPFYTKTTDCPWTPVTNVLEENAKASVRTDGKKRLRDLGSLSSSWSVKPTSHCFAVTLLHRHQSPESHYHRHKTMPMSVVTLHKRFTTADIDSHCTGYPNLKKLKTTVFDVILSCIAIIEFDVLWHLFCQVLSKTRM